MSGNPIFRNLVHFPRSNLEFQEDILSDKIYVFTPNGEVQELPRGSGPIDFAYAIHTKVGDHATGAKVNGRMKPLSVQLKSVFYLNTDLEQSQLLPKLLATFHGLY